MTDIQHYNPELVVMKNPIITSKLNFSPLQVQIMLEMVAKIHPADENFNEVKIVVKDLADKLGMDYANVYEHIEVAAKGMNTWIRIKEDDGSDYTELVFLTKVKYWKRKGHVELKFHEDLKPYLLQIKESKFFSYHIEATRHLKNYAFIKLYWFLVSWKSAKTKSILLKSLKELMEFENQYTQFPDFRKRVLQPARQAFIKYGEIYFDFEEIRENPRSKKSPVEYIKFTILSNPNWKSRKKLNFTEEEPTPLDTDKPEVQDLLRGILSLSQSISEAQAVQFIRNHSLYAPTDILSEVIAIKKVKARGKEVIDHLALLAKAVQTRYNQGLFEEQEKKKKEQEEQNKINAWRNEFDSRFNEFKKQTASQATQDEIELYKQTYPKGCNRMGEPFTDWLGQFIAVHRGLIPDDIDLNFSNWVRTHKKENIDKLNDKWRIVQSLF
jgi:plasmid replication initiation protein